MLCRSVYSAIAPTAKLYTHSLRRAAFLTAHKLLPLQLIAAKPNRRGSRVLLMPPIHVAIADTARRLLSISLIYHERL